MGYAGVSSRMLHYAKLTSSRGVLKCAAASPELHHILLPLLSKVMCTLKRSSSLFLKWPMKLRCTAPCGSVSSTQKGWFTKQNQMWNTSGDHSDQNQLAWIRVRGPVNGIHTRAEHVWHLTASLALRDLKLRLLTSKSCFIFKRIEVNL